MSERLKLDYDDIGFKDVELIFHHRGWLVHRLSRGCSVPCSHPTVQVARTRRGYHVEIDVCAPLDPREVILVQILLGSDVHREIYNLLHHLDGELVATWNKLFDKRYIILGTRLKPNGGERRTPGLTRRLRDIVGPARGR